MNLRKWWYDGKSTKWQIAIGSIAILIILLIAFGPTIQGSFTEDEEKYLDFFKEFRNVMFGGVAVAVITGVLIIFQNVVGMDREKNQKIFDQRVELYKTFLNLTMNIIDDDVLDDDERKILMKTEKEILLIASRETYLSWCQIYSEILKLPRTTSEMDELYHKENGFAEHQERVKHISKLTANFVNCCRKDLDIALIEQDDQMSKIMSEIQSEMDKHLFKRTR